MRIWRRAEPAEQVLQRGQVVDVLQALADGLEQDRERRILAGHVEQLRGPLPLLPERRAFARGAARQQQRPGRALAEPGREQRRTADLFGDDVLDLVGVESEQVGARRGVLGVGEPDDDAVVGGRRRSSRGRTVRSAARHRQRPRRVHALAVRRVQDQSPVAELVTEPFDHQGAVGGDLSGRRLLLGDELNEIVGGVVVEPAGCGSVPAPRVSCPSEISRRNCSERLAQFRRPAEAVAVPERQPAGLPVGGADQHPVVGDLLDPPAGGAEREDVADPGLVDHLLVEFADPGCFLADHVDREQTAVGDGAAGRDGQPLRARPSREGVGVAVPDEARA